MPLLHECKMCGKMDRLHSESPPADDLCSHCSQVVSTIKLDAEQKAWKAQAAKFGVVAENQAKILNLLKMAKDYDLEKIIGSSGVQLLDEVLDQMPEAIEEPEIPSWQDRRYADGLKPSDS